MKKLARSIARIVLVVLIAVVLFGSLRFGLIPQRFSPFAPLSLRDPPRYFLDARLSVLRRDPALCQSVLTTPHIDASAVADQPVKDGCGWSNAVKFSTVGGARIGVSPLTCEMAAALALWIEQDVQPLAQELFGQSVVRLGDMGSYGCRNIVGNPLWRNVRSQHASANAIDISGFTLADGHQISILKDWSAAGAASIFLKEAHKRACRYFRVTLGPEYNEAHKNHFHFDRGAFSRCK